MPSSRFSIIEWQSGKSTKRPGGLCTETGVSKPDESPAPQKHLRPFFYRPAKSDLYFCANQIEVLWLSPREGTREPALKILKEQLLIS